MPAPRVAVLRAPGTNCDPETAYAFELAGASPERLHLFEILEHPDRLREFQILCFPGGFSYGDDIGSGVIYASHLRNKLGDVLKEFTQQDKLVLGICNGFQILMKSGLLPTGQPYPATPTAEEVTATLTWNENGKYTARWVHLRTAGSNSVFLQDVERLDLPIAHAEGRIVLRSPEVLKTWREQRQCGLCYAGRDDQGTDPLESDQSFPVNPNGSTANLAGICDPTGRILGLMPHPERFLFRTQHPQWTRLDLPEEGAGLRLFRNAVSYFA